MLLVVLLVMVVGCRSVDPLVKVVKRDNLEMYLYLQGDHYTLIYRIDGRYEGYSTWRADHTPINSFGVMVHNQLSDRLVALKPELANSILYH